MFSIATITMVGVINTHTGERNQAVGNLTIRNARDTIFRKRVRLCLCGTTINRGDRCVLVHTEENGEYLDSWIVCSWECVADLREKFAEPGIND